MDNKIAKKIEVLEQAQTLEDIIIASWYLFKKDIKKFSDKVEVITMIGNKKEEFYQKELEEKRDIVYKELLVNFINGDNDIINSVSKKTNLAWWQIKQLVLETKNPNEVDKALARYMVKKYPESDTDERNNYYKIREAKAKVMIAEKSGCKCFSEFSKRYHLVPRYELENAYEIVRENDKEFYKTLSFSVFNNIQKKNSLAGRIEYLNNDRKRILEEITAGKSLSKEMLTERNRRELVVFCEVNGLSTALVKKYIARLKDKKEEFFNLSYSDQVTSLLEYKREELEKAKPVIDELIEIAINKDKTIDYHYFYSNGFRSDYFIQLLANCKLNSACHTFKNYVANHSSAFTCLTDKDVSMCLRTNKMFFENNLISYTPVEFKNVVNNLKENQLPLFKGLIVQELNKSKKDSKVIAKTNRVC